MWFRTIRIRIWNCVASTPAWITKPWQGLMCVIFVELYRKLETTLIERLQIPDYNEIQGQKSKGNNPSSRNDSSKPIGTFLILEDLEYSPTLLSFFETFPRSTGAEMKRNPFSLDFGMENAQKCLSCGKLSCRKFWWKRHIFIPVEEKKVHAK